MELRAALFFFSLESANDAGHFDDSNGAPSIIVSCWWLYRLLAAVFPYVQHQISLIFLPFRFWARSLSPFSALPPSLFLSLPRLLCGPLKLLLLLLLLLLLIFCWPFFIVIDRRGRERRHVRSGLSPVGGTPNDERNQPHLRLMAGEEVRKAKKKIIKKN